MKHTLLQLFAFTAAAVLVPGPPGPYNVAMEVQEVTDASRPADPFDATSQSRGRRLLFSVFLPIQRTASSQSCPVTTVPYMTPKVAAAYGQQAADLGLPGDLYSQFDFGFCDLSKMSPCGSPRQKRKPYPVILFTPGLEDSRLLYGAGARSLASHGYVVVTVDHPYEAPFVEFPDGTVIVGRNISGDDEAGKTQLMAIRTTDLSFVVDQLHNRTMTNPLLSNFPGSLDLSNLAIYAHSVGGSAAAAVTRADKRVLGGVDLDGQLTEPIRDQGLSKPFMLAGRFNHSNGGTDPTWNEFWPHLRGPRVELAINGTEHASYTDRVLLLSALNLPPPVQQALIPLLGSVAARRLETISNSVLMGFFDFVFRHNKQSLESLPRMFSEVTIPRSNL